MRILNSKKISKRKIKSLFSRPSENNCDVKAEVELILSEIKRKGDKAVTYYAKKFDGFTGQNILTTKDEFIDAEKQISTDLKRGVKVAFNNIKKFHKCQLPLNYTLETVKGVSCSRKFLPIENVGLYVPGGNAVLISTILMLAIPAKIAGCQRIILSTPCKKNKLDPAVLYTAKLCGINEVYKIGGAQAIGMMAYGTNKFKKVNKIFGPGNQYVTNAKTLVSIDPSGCAIDMPAGPSEVLIIADTFANPEYVASDLISQAEHGEDSQVILLTDSLNFAQAVNKEVIEQLKKLPRKKIAEKSLSASFILIVKDINEAIDLSNEYAPEHLIINLKSSDKYLNRINNAGSVFIGQYSPESAGDYSSGTNHSLPTYGYAKSFGGVSVEMFMKAIVYQKLTKAGLKNISSSIITLAETEQLHGHANAIKVRLKNEN
jgi:histidinol dehydrogenase